MACPARAATSMAPVIGSCRIAALPDVFALGVRTLPARSPHALLVLVARRIFRPVVLGIAAAHVPPHIGPAAPPEARQVGGDRRPAARPATAAQAAMARGRRPASASPSPRRTPAPSPRRAAPAACSPPRRGRRATSRCAGSAASSRPTRSQATARAASPAGPAAPDRRAATTREVRRQPVRTVGISAASDRSGHAVVGLQRAHQRHARLELPRRSVQGSGRSRRPPPHGPGAPAISAGSSRLGAVAQHQRAKPPPPPRQHRAGDRIEAGLHLLGHARRQRGGKASGSSGAASRMRAAAFISRLRTASSARLPADRRAAAARRRRRRAGSCRARRAAGRCGRGTRRRAAGRVAVGRRVSGRRSRRRYWAAARRMRDSAPDRHPVAVRDRREPQPDIRRRVGRAQRVAFLQQRGEVGGERRLGRRLAPPASSRPAADARRVRPCAGRLR